RRTQLGEGALITADGGLGTQRHALGKDGKAGTGLGAGVDCRPGLAYEEKERGRDQERTEGNGQQDRQQPQAVHPGKGRIAHGSVSLFKSSGTSLQDAACRKLGLSTRFLRLRTG